MIPVYTVATGNVEGLPEQAGGVLLIVSAMVRCAAPERRDLVSPADFARDEKGNIVGCRSFDINF